MLQVQGRQHLTWQMPALPAAAAAALKTAAAVQLPGAEGQLVVVVAVAVARVAVAAWVVGVQAGVGAVLVLGQVDVQGAGLAGMGLQLRQVAARSLRQNQCSMVTVFMSCQQEPSCCFMSCRWCANFQAHVMRQLPCQRHSNKSSGKLTIGIKALVRTLTGKAGR